MGPSARFRQVGRKEKKQHGQLGQREMGTGNGVGQGPKKEKRSSTSSVLRVVVSGQWGEYLLKADRGHKYEWQFDELSLPCTLLLNEAYGRYLL
jgi:hypothetical protein